MKDLAATVERSQGLVGENCKVFKRSVARQVLAIDKMLKTKYRGVFKEEDADQYAAGAACFSRTWTKAVARIVRLGEDGESICDWVRSTTCLNLDSTKDGHPNYKLIFLEHKPSSFEDGSDEMKQKSQAAPVKNEIVVNVDRKELSAS